MKIVGIVRFSTFVLSRRRHHRVGYCSTRSASPHEIDATEHAKRIPACTLSVTHRACSATVMLLEGNGWEMFNSHNWVQHNTPTSRRKTLSSAADSASGQRIVWESRRKEDIMTGFIGYTDTGHVRRRSTRMAVRATALVASAAIGLSGLAACGSGSSSSGSSSSGSGTDTRRFLPGNRQSVLSWS